LKEDWKIKVKNSFNAGNLKVNGSTVASGTTVSGFEWKGSITVVADEANKVWTNGYYKRLTDWTVESVSQGHSNNSINTIANWQINDPPTFIAELRDEYNVHFQNNFISNSNNGAMEIEGINQSNISYSNPFYVLKDYNIEAKVTDWQVFNSIKYFFVKWEDNNSTSKTRTFYPDSHEYYSALFLGKPLQVTGLSSVGAIGQAIELEWDQHPNSNCKYKVYRKNKQQGNVEVYVTTLNNNVTTYTDDLYKRTRTYSDFLLSFDVRAYYTTEQTEADPLYLIIFGDYYPSINDGVKISTIEGIPQNYTISNYPNPFNPSATLQFTVPKTSFINISIFDNNGKKIKTVLSGLKEEGFHSIKWNGQNESGVKVVSGLYFVRFTAPGVIKNHKLLLMK